MPKKATSTPTKATTAATKKPTGVQKGKPGQNPLIERKPKNFGIGQNIHPGRDLTRYVRWPRYVTIQRQRRILMNRLKVPPTLNQFTRAADKPSAVAVFKLLHKYRPETRVAKKARLLKTATENKDAKVAKPAPAPNTIKYGLNQVTSCVEQKKAKLVVIAHDVEPVELVVWLPTLCRKMNVPYIIVKGKSRLGEVVHKKTATCLAITSVDAGDVTSLASIAASASDNFNKNTETRRTWGGGILGTKAQHAKKKRDRAVAKERGGVAAE
eukprot:TRINITY_DN10926_c1_g1_i1.p1 TRINITY_DN10926_c1_g1~~TRINITY_DN10926_c1_g1_i1.p1  ORF type:complete len:269 (+),score=93.27 TRINITY_DN10926_c1_g1_i1:68-874(+)